jgi:hypothetical protein
LSVEDVRLAKELESQGVEGVCEYVEMADVEPAKAPDTCNEITIGAGWSSNDVKVEDITWDFDFGGQPLCISGSPYPPEEKQFSTLVSTSCVEPDLAISSITITNDWGSFEPGQTALAELDMEIGDGSIKYIREIKLGTFTFKDAGALGVDIFSNGTKIGWLNNKGEESLKQWLGEKSVAQENVSVMGKTYTIGVDPAVGNDEETFRKEVYPDYNSKSYDRNFHPYITKEVSNEIVEVAYVGQHNTYQLKNKNIVPGSFILTAHVNGVALQSENLKGDGTLPCTYYGFSHTYACDRPTIYEAKLDHNTGLITVNWINFHSTDNRRLSVCYEYKDYEVKESKVC